MAKLTANQAHDRLMSQSGAMKKARGKPDWPADPADQCQ